MYDMIQLPYAFNALQPYIDEETIKTHYGKHLQTYTNNLNNILKGYETYIEGKTLFELLYKVNELPEEIRQSVINNGGGVFNHNLYFAQLSPTPKKSPEGELLKAINEAFNSLDELKEKLSNAAIGTFGSGYAMLVKDKEGRLSIKQVQNQNTTVCEGLVPILNIDVWEHAYYLKYKNLRAEYVKNIWHIIDWEKAEGLYKEFITL